MKNINIGIIGYDTKFSKFYEHTLKTNSIYKVKFLIKKNINKGHFKEILFYELKKK